MATGALKAEEDTDRLDQLSFMRKVLGIVGGQLVVTFVVILCAAASGYGSGFWQFCVSNGCFITCICVYMTTLIVLMCSRQLRHQSPMNYILLFLFTLSMAFMLAGITAWLSFESVLLSIGVLMLTLCCLFGGVMLVPAKPKLIMGMIIAAFCACFLQIIIGISLCFAGYIYSGWYVFYCVLGILIASILIYIDLVIVMLAGKYAMDEYIYCALLLYLDIIRLFLYILMLFGKGK